MDLIVVDTVLGLHASVIKKELDHQDTALRKYINSLKYIRDEAIISGDVHDQLTDLIDLAEEILSLSKGQGGEVNSTIKKFVKRIDEIDQELY